MTDQSEYISHIQQENHPLTPDEQATLEKIMQTVENDQEFVWLYRAEGPQEDRLTSSGDNTLLVGAWFTDNFYAAKGIQIEREKNNDDRLPENKIEFKIFAVIIPKRVKDALDEGDQNLMPTQEGREYLIRTTDLRKNKVEVLEPISTLPKKEDYLRQFDLFNRNVKSNTPA